MTAEVGPSQPGPNLEAAMQIQLIRSATLRVEYARRRFVIDPYLAAKHSRPSYAGKSANPLVDLPFSPLEVIAGIDLVLISHLHSDHFDPAAQELLPKETAILCQSEDRPRIEAIGFRRVIPVADTTIWHEMTITRMPCQHGSGKVLAEMGLSFSPGAQSIQGRPGAVPR